MPRTGFIDAYDQIRDPRPRIDGWKRSHAVVQRNGFIITEGLGPYQGRYRGERIHF